MEAKPAQRLISARFATCMAALLIAPLIRGLTGARAQRHVVVVTACETVKLSVEQHMVALPARLNWSNESYAAIRHAHAS